MLVGLYSGFGRRFCMVLSTKNWVGVILLLQENTYRKGIAKKKHEYTGFDLKKKDIKDGDNRWGWNSKFRDFWTHRAPYRRIRDDTTLSKTGVINFPEVKSIKKKIMIYRWFIQSLMMHDKQSQRERQINHQGVNELDVHCTRNNILL